MIHTSNSISWRQVTNCTVYWMVKSRQKAHVTPFHDNDSLNICLVNAEKCTCFIHIQKNNLRFRVTFMMFLYVPTDFVLIFFVVVLQPIRRGSVCPLHIDYCRLCFGLTSHNIHHTWCILVYPAEQPCNEQILTLSINWFAMPRIPVYSIHSNTIILAPVFYVAWHVSWILLNCA